MKINNCKKNFIYNKHNKSDFKEQIYMKNRNFI